MSRSAGQADLREDRDDHPEDEGSFLEGSEEEGSEWFEDEESEEEFNDDCPPQVMESRDKILHWWCHRQLLRTLRKLEKLPKAGPFREPLPWEELGLDDYLEIIPDPVDLRTISERLESGEYDDEDGFLDPAAFWEEIAICWENCKVYYEDDEEIEAVRMAEEMRLEAESMEDSFWADLDEFEKSLDRVGGPALWKVAAVADLASGALEDAASEAQTLLKRTAQWLAGWRGQKEEAPPKPKQQVQLLMLAAKPRLRDHFQELMLMRFKEDLTKDLDEIYDEVTLTIEDCFPSFDDDADADVFKSELEFEGSEKLIPIDKLVPGRHGKRMGSLALPGERRKNNKSWGAKRRNSGGLSRASSIRSSPDDSGSRPSSRTSLRSQTVNSGENSRAHSEERSMNGSRANSEERSNASRGSRTSSNHSARRTRRRPSDAVNSKQVARAIRRSLGSEATLVPGMETSDESGREQPRGPGVEALREVLPKRKGSTTSNASAA
eukprot:TRINITY_DN34143_c0_g1_i1.p1 TRINITY_DN34143_c0_g1~~TRINITY_DN34143_c0_g1_i1.p1  ORF type:complete len:494 (+),score=110.56 TRINITY_DN34143_c0_g1_i1:134-1615(+)